MADALARHGVRQLQGAGATAVARIAGRLTVTLSTGEAVGTDAVLFAAGRTPNTEGLGQDAFGVVGSRGHQTCRFRNFRTHPRRGE